jgi:hypothetical protein
MMFVAYVDESDTHGPEPDIFMLADLAPAKNWALFERRFRGLKRDFGFSVLHGVELRTQSGEFKGWPYQKHMELHRQLGELLQSQITESFSVVCPYAVYKEHFLDVRPRKMHATSQYGVCFEAIMLGIVLKVMDQRRTNPKLSVVVEDGHNNAPDTARIFSELKADYLKKGVDLLRTHTLASKGDCDPLMATDYFAYGSARRERDIKAGLRPRIPEGAPIPTKDDIGHSHMQITPNYLAMRIDDFHKRKADAHEEYLRRRELWQSLKQQPPEGQPA